MPHPYDTQPDHAFWRRAVGDRAPEEIGDWYRKRFSLDGQHIATAGSCFAQHIGRHLRGAGFDCLDVEPAPAGLPPELHRTWGYGLYSARYGNIYTSRQLVQLVDRALGRVTPVADWWEKDGGIVDPFRPTIEPEPFGSVAEMRALRADHLDRVAAMFGQMDVFVVTLGLTEAWLSRQDGACYPLCPGTAGGAFDPALHQLRNLGSAEVRADMETLLGSLRAINPRLQVLLTVSPVSLMATATAQQVSVATTYSKSVLRAVAGELHEAHECVDYFPSYDIITGPASRGAFYQPGMRDVSPDGVAHVMGVFMAEHRPVPVDDAPKGPLMPRMAPGMAPHPASHDAESIQCDEELLNSFGRPPG